MSSKIVVGLDGSVGSDRALEAAAEVAKRDGAALVLCHVVERIAAKGDMAPVHADEPDVKARVEEQAAGLREQGVEAEARFAAIVLGGPARAIADLAEEVGADLIVVGTRGHSALAGVLLGSVTQKLLHLAQCPVLCIPSPRD
ncbi:MAG: universal stress protein [Acidobacteria bacterium]|nr:MAG: universal stress protein [Acidobacteriota bacterium]GIK77962.1 MAG: universal stress protein [Actinomycetes bacterium]